MVKVESVGKGCHTGKYRGKCLIVRHRHPAGQDVIHYDMSSFGIVQYNQFHNWFGV